jgi:hypothetical protein
MKFKISSDILNDAVKCNKNFSCLTGSNDCLCKIQSNYESKVIFIESIDDICNYRMSFGYSYVCNCPVRKEIFRQYKV